MGRERARALGGTLTAVVFLAIAFAGGVGCTFLISFDDKPKKDAGSSVDDTPTDTATDTVPTDTVTATATVTTPLPDASVTFTGEGCDTAENLASVPGCSKFAATPNAQACATSTSFSPYPFTSTESRDLVTCNASVVTCIQHCTTRCVSLPEGFPDACDHCQGKTDGDYCGSELGWTQKEDARVLAHCTGGFVSTLQEIQTCDPLCIPGTTPGTSHCD